MIKIGKTTFEFSGSYMGRAPIITMTTRGKLGKTIRSLILATPFILAIVSAIAFYLNDLPMIAYGVPICLVYVGIQRILFFYSFGPYRNKN